MIPTLRQHFNANYAPEKYQRLLKVMEERCGAPVKFRVCETPVFLPKPLLDQMCQYGKELIQQLNGIEYRKASSEAIPEQFKVPREKLTPDDDFFKTLGIDSLQALDLLTRLEHHFNVELPDYELQGVADFRTLAGRIQARL